AQFVQVARLFGQFARRYFARRAEADDSGDVQRARTHSALMAAAIDNRRQPDARAFGAYVQRADSLGSVNLVPAHRQQVDSVLVDVDWNLADRLDRVAVENDPLLFRELADFANRMNRADLVVRVHDRDQHGLVGNRPADRIRIDHSVLVDRQIGDRRLALALQRSAAIEHSLVLGHAGDDVVALFLVELDDALDRQVVGLGRAAGENDFLRLGVDNRRDLIARLVDSFFGFPSKAVVAA